LASGPAHAGPTRLPHPPYPRPDGERHLRRSRSVQRLLCKTYTASRRCIDLEGELSLPSHTFGSLPPCRERGPEWIRLQSLGSPEQASCSGLFLPQRTDAPHNSDSVQAEAISSSLPIAALDLILPNHPLREQWVFHQRQQRPSLSRHCFCSC